MNRDWSYLHTKHYTLYIRSSDQRTLLVDNATGQAVGVRSVWLGSRYNGVFVELVKGIGVYLMDEEIRMVDVFPEVRVKQERKRRWKIHSGHA